MPQLILPVIVTAINGIARTLLLCNAIGFDNVPTIKIKRYLGKSLLLTSLDRPKIF